MPKGLTLKQKRMNKKVLITFPICLKEYFFDDTETLKKIQKKEEGFEMISVKRSQNNLEIKIPCHVQGLKDRKQTYFVFLLPKKAFGKELKPKYEKFFKKGLCRIEGIANCNNCSILTFEGEYEETSTSLKGTVNYYKPPHFGWWYKKNHAR